MVLHCGYHHAPMLFAKVLMPYLIDINVSKTKAQVFHRGQLPECSFSLHGREIEIVNNFVYLGFDFSTQLSFSQHARTLTSKARSKCGLLFSRLPILDLPLQIVLDLYSAFILPIFTYGLPLWLSNCCASTLQMVDSTFTKFLKRYFMVPPHSNNAKIHFLSSTIPLSNHLKIIAPNVMGALSFPTILHGIQLSFTPDSSHETAGEALETLKKIPSTFWLSRILPSSMPSNRTSRKRLMREILDSDHFRICQTSTFHPYPLPSCICTHCGANAHLYHQRYCTT